MKPVEIMGVPITPITRHQIPEIIADYLEETQCRSIMTPNPEMVMAAQKHDGLMDALKSSDLVLPDGIGLIIASKIKKMGLKERVTGIDTMDQILYYCHQTEKRVFLLGSKPGVAEQAATNIKEKYSGIQIAGTHHGYFDNDDSAHMIQMINQSHADVLFAGLGFPRQEIWIQQQRGELKCKIAMGIGGSLDVYAGVAKRAPLAFQKVGLEWFYRLMKEPWRIKRMTVLPQFLWKIIWK